jgi:hypothetical protein
MVLNILIDKKWRSKIKTLSYYKMIISFIKGTKQKAKPMYLIMLWLKLTNRKTGISLKRSTWIIKGHNLLMSFIKTKLMKYIKFFLITITKLSWNAYKDEFFENH